LRCVQHQSCNIVETDQALWALCHAEPGVYFAAVAPKEWLPRHVTQRNLHALLLHAHRLVQLLHGGVQALLDQVCNSFLPTLLLHEGGPTPRADLADGCPLRRTSAAALLAPR
jgi:hypothetical protein